jgi:hypothetical protein
MSDIKFATFPFEYKGYKFVSKIAETNRFLPQIMLMGDDFITMNKSAVDELINLDENTSLLALEKALEYINAGGTEMFLELVGN